MDKEAQIEQKTETVSEKAEKTFYSPKIIPTIFIGVILMGIIGALIILFMYFIVRTQERPQVTIEAPSPSAKL